MTRAELLETVLDAGLIVCAGAVLVLAYVLL